MAGRPQVLVVDDDRDTRQLYRDALSFAGFEVREARGGLEALRKIDTNRPDVIVLDVGMPGFDGAAVRQELAASEHTRHIPVVLVTGMTGNFDWLHPDCLLRKPIGADELVWAVKRCLALGAGPATG